MKRTALLITAVLAVAALAITATRPKAPPMPTPEAARAATPAATAPVAPRPAPRSTRREIRAQREVLPAAERRRVDRTRLLDATLVTAAQAHGVSLLAGPARASNAAPQQMVVTPDDGMTVREIATAVSQICGALKDPCAARDYRFLIQTPTGQAPVPARLIHPDTKDPR